MNRMTVRQGDIVYLSKDGELLPPALMSSYDVRIALMKLADYEDKEEERLKELHEMYEQGKFDGAMEVIYESDIQFLKNGGAKLLSKGICCESKREWRK